MLRDSNFRTLDWVDKTMSAINDIRIDRCERRISDYPETDVFSTDNQAIAEPLWSFSFAADESSPDELLTLDKIRAEVLSHLPWQVVLLSLPERILLERLMVDNGRTELTDDSEAQPAENLVRRQWCHLEWIGEERLFLVCSDSILYPLNNALSDERCIELQDRMLRYDMVLHTMLYTYGCLDAISVFAGFEKIVSENKIPDGTLLFMRYLKTAYDYAYAPDGRLIILHQGLADTSRLTRNAGLIPVSIEEEANNPELLDAIGGILPEEIHDALFLLDMIEPAVRPQLHPKDVVDDIRILAKQGVKIEDMQAVLRSALIVQPTPAMKEALATIALKTTRWSCMKATVVN